MKEEIKKTIIPAIIKLIICSVIMITSAVVMKNIDSEIFQFLDALLFCIGGFAFLLIFTNTFMTRRFVDRNKEEIQ